VRLRWVLPVRMAIEALMSLLDILAFLRFHLNKEECMFLWVSKRPMFFLVLDRHG